MNCERFVELCNNWQGKVCLFGAGVIGKTWAYELIYSTGLEISFYCDNYKAGEVINGIEVKSAEYLYENANNLLCFVTVMEKYSREIVKQLEQHGIVDVFVVNDFGCINELARYDDENPGSIRGGLKEIIGDKWYISRQFENVFGYKPNLDSPSTMNEKIQWLKLYDRNPQYQILVDKYRVREYISRHFGSEYLVPLLFVTEDYNDIVPDNIPDMPCVIKSNCSSHDFEIIRSKEQINWERLQMKYKKVMESNFYYIAREWCYKGIKPVIIVEKLLQLDSGKIPNDYKLHFFNGRCEFVYCAIDREGMDYRKIYDINWNELRFDWSTPDKNYIPKTGPGIKKPATFDDMLRIGSIIAQDKRDVRVDFYDVNGKLYCGEITLYHGAGYDRFIPDKYDKIYGEKLVL